MAQVINFAQLLRPVGQMLEPLKLESFSLKIDDSGVYVSGRKRAERPPSPVPEVSLRVVWQALRRKPPDPASEAQPSSGLLELRYTVGDIERRDDEEQSKRKDAGGTPEAHALPQILRAVGGYVDQKGGRLLEVRKAADDLTIEYESALRKKMTEQFTVASLYDYWVKMYLRRKKS
jgi:hypothetical protein